MDTASKQELTFDPPGPGPWDLDDLHFPRPVTPYWAEMHPEPFSHGYALMTAFYGVPRHTVRVAFPGGFSYVQTVPLAEEDLPARARRAAETFENKLWRESAREWHEVRKPASMRANRELQAVDPEQLSDADLVEHLRSCRDNHVAMIAQHMEFTGTAVISPGDFLAHAKEWTGLPTVKLLGLMRGASTVSGGSSPEQARMVAAFRADDTARKELDSDEDPGALLDRLRRDPSAAGRALDEYLNLVGNRPLDGFDISNHCAIELPDVLVRSLRTAIDEPDGQPGHRSERESGFEAQAAEVRGKVPPEHREEYDALLEEARIGYSVRDERGIYGDAWAAGLMRRAALAAGRRLEQRGRLLDAEHFIFADFGEMCALLEGASSPTSEELAGRYEYYRTYTAKDAPAHLGDPGPTPKNPGADRSQLPPEFTRLLTAMGTAGDEMFASSVEAHEDKVIKGLGASSGVREGVVRRVSGAADFDRIQKGDVLLTEATTEAFNILLPLLSAIITDTGGALSHAAIVSREYGIPGVVGTRDGTAQIPDGTRVRVDGDAGTVTVLD